MVENEVEIQYWIMRRCFNLVFLRVVNLLYQQSKFLAFGKLKWVIASEELLVVL